MVLPVDYFGDDCDVYLIENLDEDAVEKADYVKLEFHILVLCLIVLSQKFHYCEQTSYHSDRKHQKWKFCYQPPIDCWVEILKNDFFRVLVDN